jgi:hypothetical protein
MSAVYDSDLKKWQFFPLYGFAKLDVVWERLTYLAGLFDLPIVVNDFKAHIEGWAYLRECKPVLLPTNKDYSAYVVPDDEDINMPRDEAELRKYLAAKIGMAKKVGNAQWQLQLGDATLAYLALEKRGVKYGGLEVYPNYELKTFTGRSSTTGFNIQGQGDGEDIAHIDDDKNVFVHADWISADMRALSLLSDDAKMQESFETADPYKLIENQTGRDRDSCKVELLKSIYSLNTNSPAFEVFPKLRSWIIESIDMMRNNGYTSSILGRRYYPNKDRDERAVFNAPIQGSVAHAMQNSVIRISKQLPRHLLTELHDSMVVCCTKTEAPMVIDVVQNVMLHPFRDILPSDPTFPLKVSIGGKWRAWKQLKELR